MRLLVLHDAGDAAPVERWRRLVDAWDGPTLLPVQPGHGDAPPPEGGNYSASDAAVFASRAMAEARWSGDRPMSSARGGARTRRSCWPWRVERRPWS